MKISPNLFKTPVTLLAVLALSSGLSCAVTPTTQTQEPDQQGQMSRRAASAAVQDAFDQFSRRDFAAAMTGFDNVADSANANPDDRRLAYVGKSLIYLSTDREWRDLDAAAGSLQSAESTAGGSNPVQHGMLLNAVSALIGAEKNNAELKGKVNNAAYELGKLKEALESQDAEVASLNDALEKLKDLTIGN